VLNPGQSATEEELKAWVHERLAPYKVPTRIRFVSEIPQTQLLKVSRPALRLLFDQPA